MSTLAQMFRREGKAEGRMEGRMEGEAISEAKAILRTLRKRFFTVPESLEMRVFAITDMSRLEELADFAYDCESLDEFVTAL